ncbi:MAG: TonB-dependent receptor [Paraglaciecola sp.]|uniref:TonB-dependent receptor domain-containing protein n=1 Tax=Paraglaciecola sp. TaxID=1920173 RepID=UPI00329A4454
MKIFKKCPLRTAVAVGVSSSLFFGGAVIAQESNEDSAEENNVELIVVTGSRIKSSDATAASPLQTIDAAVLEEQAVINVQEALQLNPAFGAPGSSRASSASNNVSAGTATVNLRGLGADRTLVLVDGKRMVSGIPGTTQVDLAMVPTGFVDRIEVLTGGASAVYGSDAIAGVVNLIYKKNFEGFIFNTQAGQSQEGDDSQLKLDLTAGQNFDNDRGNVMFNLGWTQQGAMLASDREFTAVASQSAGVAAKDPTRLYERLDAFSGHAPAGQVGSYTFDPNGNALPSSELIRMDNAPYQSLASPVNRLTFALHADYEVNDDMTVYLDTNYGQVNSKSYSEPVPFWAHRQNIGIGANLPIEHRVYDGSGNMTMVNNPFLPQEVFDEAIDTDGDGLKDVTIARRLVEFGGRTSPIDRDLFRVVMGAEGYIGEDWSYDANYSYSRSNLSTTMDNLFHGSNIEDALNAITDVYDFDGDGDTTDAVCTRAQARANGCVAMNMFGAGTITEEMLAYSRTKMVQRSTQDMQTLAANVSGTVFELPAGGMDVAFGAEYREESTEHIFDALTNNQQNGYTQANDTVGEYDVFEVYGETAVPLLDSLNLNLAARAADYSTIGSASAYNFGLEWSPTDSLRFRAVYAEAVRAPNIKDLYRPAKVGVSSINDPCNGVTATSVGTADDNCRAEAGINTNIAENGSVVFTNSDTAGVLIKESSNPNIQEETATTYTLGAVYSPSRDLVVTVDYYDITIDDAIAFTSNNVILSKCYVESQQNFCDLIDRSTVSGDQTNAGSVSEIRRQNINSGGASTKGVDFTANYSTELAGGDIALSVSWSHLLEDISIPLAGEVPKDSVGETKNPENKIYGAINWTQGPLKLNVTTRYFGAWTYDDEWYQGVFGDDVQSSYFDVDGYLTIDTRVSYDFNENYNVSLGIKNLTDESPQIIYGNMDGGSWQQNTDSGIYDAVGRRFYAGFTATF